MHSRVSRALGLAALFAFTGPLAAFAVDTRDTAFLHEPAITAGRIVFVYADDLWTARPDGTDVRRLTAHPGPESSPYISPDGQLVAFNATYDGNADVYVVPIEGGEPTRLTWHPGPDAVVGFAPDGAVLFRSPRSVLNNRHNQFFKVSPKGGTPEALPIPSGFRAAYSPDGKYLAYTPLSEMFRQWKNYRGGTASRVWILKLDDLSVEMIHQPEGRCNDIYPMWIGDTVYFLSDRAGEFNLFSLDRKSKAITQLTHHDEFPVEAASAGAGRVIYEQGGHLWTFDPTSKRLDRLKIGVAADLPETRPRFVSGAKYIRSAGISPTGQRAAFEFRGEILSLPAKKGDVRNLTHSAGVHERSPVWSPDGKSIAYFSDASGEYALHVSPQDGKGAPRAYPLKGAGFYERPSWSPDSKKMAFIDNARTLFWIDLASGKVTRVGSEAVYGPVNTLTHAWSPDSKWLAYTLTNKAYMQTLRLYSLEGDKSHAVTDGLAEVAEPAFDASGKYLYFLASTDAGPVKQWFDQSNSDVQATHSIFVAVLAKKTPNPLLKPNDEEAEDKAKKDEKKDEPKSTVIDINGLDSRVLALPIPGGNLSGLIAGDEGKIYYLRRVGMIPGKTGDAYTGTPSLVRFDLKTREEETLADKIDGFSLSADRKKILYASKESWGIADAGKFTPGGKDRLAVEAISVRIEPRAEWSQIFNEAWRINRDYFYDRGMHGADWPALKTKYEKLLPEVPTREDLSRVIRGLCSELAVGHSFLIGGDRLHEPKPVPVGLLGADYDVADGRYRFKKVYGGLNWDTELKAPLIAPGVDVKAGEYLIAVDGEDIQPDREVYSHFENKVGRRVELKVGPKADGTDSRTVVVEPIASEAALRNRDWVEGNLRKVHERTNGRVAYVYVPNTADLGHAYFKRYFFPQVDKEAIIVDERFNGGGSVADYYIDILRRPVVSFWAMRYGAPIRSPGAAILGPKVMLIDETAGSGGDLLPWMFRKFQLGTLVGRRTWGGLVGILGFPTLMDGGRVTAPDLAFYTEDGWRVENEGVPPDIEVEQWPAAVAAGKDPQLDKAIEVILEALKRDAPKMLEPPSPPVRVRRKETSAAVDRLDFRLGEISVDAEARAGTGDDHQTALRALIEGGGALVGIIGMGYVGLPLSRAFVSKGVSVLGFDTDAAKVAKLVRGQSYIGHIGDDVIQSMRSVGLFDASVEFDRLGEPDVVIICVPTPLDETREPDLSYVVASSRAIAARLRPGQLVVLESTTYPGTTRDVVLPILESSGLRAGRDFFLAYSPEREDPGNPVYSAPTIPKVVGGLDPASLELASALYARVVVRVEPVSSPEVAEACKILENTYRAVNIALVNELKLLYDRMGIDVWEVIEAAKTKPFGFQAFYPGPGLGGHCIPIDPFYLTWVARKFHASTRFIELAGEINTSMPGYVISRVADALNDSGKPIKGSKVLILGMAYKKDVDDPRESPGFELMDLLLSKGAVVEYNDPHIPTLPSMRKYPHLKMSSVELTAAQLATRDLVLIVTDHSAYDWPFIVAHSPLIVDTRNATKGLLSASGKIVKA